MKLRTFLLMCTALFLVVTIKADAQLTPWFQWTLIPQNQMDEIIGEASGETAYNHIIEMGAYNKDRKEAEYAGTFYEAQYVLDRMLEYGLDGAEIVRFPGGQTWDGIAGELWEVTPVRQKLASYTDLRAMLAGGSNSADVTAELVWVGDGGRDDFEGLDVAGKIVVTSGSVGGVHNIACGQLGAEGVISFNSPRPLYNSELMPMSGIRGGNAKFAFLLPPREGHVLRDRLKRGEKITVHAQVETTMREYELQDPVCFIRGTNPELESVIFSAHLFEGYTKQGANDNKSGCAGILEMARTLHVLIEQGRLPRPKRNIRFLWGPEFSGTGPWVTANNDIIQKTLCNINLDMVGLGLSENQTFITMLRTTYGNPHYINDVLENYYRYVGETNREYVQNRGSGSKFMRRIVAPSGSEDPMYYYIGVHYGSSDHEVFNDWGTGVPGVIMNTWGDPWYHTSEDRANKIDPTEMKRVVVMGAAAAYTIANADDNMAMQIAAEIVSNGERRMGHQLARGIAELKQTGSDNFPAVYKKVRGYVEACAINERATLASAIELADDQKTVGDLIVTLQESITGIENGNLQTLDAYMEVTAKRLGTPQVQLALTELEKKAEKIIPRPTSKITENGYRGYQQAISAARQGAGTGGRGRGGGSTTEIQLLCDGKNSALDMKKLCDTQFNRETDLQAILDHLELLKRAGLVTY
ncbi:M28 family metallopeptidase [candidate division KSB1 bacterium]